MNRDTIASALGVLTPLILTLLGAIAAYFSRLIAAHIKDRRAALALELAGTGAASVVADLYQHTVKDLKDPAKPGKWDAVTAAAVKLRAVALVKQLYPQAVTVLTQSVADPAHVDVILGHLVEHAVVELKAMTEGPKIDVSMIEGVSADPPGTRPTSAPPAPSSGSSPS